jgi:hypothetical protein
MYIILRGKSAFTGKSYLEVESIQYCWN